MRIVAGCPCGLAHRMSDVAWREYQAAGRGRPSDVPVGNGYACWRVPRLYLICHGVPTSAELRALAERYGWPEVR